MLEGNVISFNRDRKNRGEPECNAYVIQKERRRLEYYCRNAIYEYAKGQLPKAEIVYGLTHLYDLLEKIGKEVGPIIWRVPADITIVGRDYAYELTLKMDLKQRGYGAIVESIEGLGKLCEYLGRPDNHLQVKTRQRRPREVPTRTVADMVNEMTGKLTELPRYTAYAKVVEVKGEQSVVRKCKIRRDKLPDAPAGALAEAMKVVERLASSYCRPRGEIEEEIRKRQERWRQVSASRPPAQARTAAQPAGMPVEPPPTRTSTRLPTDR